MSLFFQRLQEDLEQLCDPADVMLVTHVNGRPTMVTVEVHSTSDENCRVILHAGMMDAASKELARKMDAELRSMLDRSPYRLVKRTPDGTATHYLVKRAAAPAQPAAPVTPAPPRAAVPAPVAKAPAATEKPTIVVTDTNLSPAAHKLPADALAALGFSVEAKHKANLSSDSPAHINLVSNSASWKTIFGPPASAYVAKHTELLGRYRDSRRQLRMAVAKAVGTAAAPIQRVAAMLADTQKTHGEPIVAWVVLDEYRLALKVPLHDIEESTEAIARFTHQLDAIAAAAPPLWTRLLDGKRLTAKMEDDGFALEWINKSDQQQCAQHFDPAGKSLGPPARVDASY